MLMCYVNAKWYQQKYIGMYCDMNVYLIKYLCWENC